MAQLNWTFTAPDRTVKKYLPAEDVKKVTTWQTDADYTFEFHDGHTTGYPIYVRMDGSTVSKNLTKFDTKGIASPSLTNRVLLTKITNDNPKKLSTTALTALEDLITDEWAHFKTIAERYWTAVPVVVIKTRVTYVCTMCQTTYSFDSALGKGSGTDSVRWECKKKCKKYTTFKVVG